MASSATSELKEFARQLLDQEAAATKLAGAENSSAFLVCEKLRDPLGKLMGTGGFRSLLARALALAGANVPWLRALHVKADGSLEGLAELEAELDSRAIAQGETALAAELLGLLVTFIGTALTLQLLHDVWPQLDDLNF